MKKVTGIFGFIAIATMLFFNINTTNNNNNNNKLTNLLAISFANAQESEGGGSFGNYDEIRVTNECSTTWNLGVWSETVEGTYYICIEGDEWFCNSGCYAPGESPA